MKTFFKTLYVLIISSVVGSSIASAQIDVTLIAREHGRFHISCYGGNDGSIEAIITGEQPPFSFQWTSTTGYTSYMRNISGLTKGEYTLTVTDNVGNTVQSSIQLDEPKPLNIYTEVSEYEGNYNVRCQGCLDGTIRAGVQGGTPDYTFLWSTGSNRDGLEEIGAGNYSVTVTDVNGCSASTSVTLTQPTPLHFVSVTSPQHNGKNISCNEWRDGVINIEVAGGSGNYYVICNGNSKEGVGPFQFGELRAGEYSVEAFDGNKISVRTTIVLTEPDPLRLELIASTYPPDYYNLSCTNCANGSLTPNITGGTSPFTYLWSNGNTTSTTSTLSNLQARDYSLIVTDVNGCRTESGRELNAPPAENWDGADYVIKTGGTERLRIRGNNPGTIETTSPIKISAALPDDFNPVYVDNTGLLRLAPSGNSNQAPCVNPVNAWFNNHCNGYNSADIFLRTGLGKVGIGTDLPSAKLDVIGTIRSSNLSGTTGFNVVYTGTNGVLQILNPPNSNASSNVLFGDGSWHPIPNNVFIDNGSFVYTNTVHPNAYFGFSNNNPSEKISIGNELVIHDGGTKVFARNFHWNGTTTVKLVDGYSHALAYGADGSLSLQTSQNGLTGAPIVWNTGLTMNNTGQVGINSSPDLNYSLKVGGNINASDLTINSLSGNANKLLTVDANGKIGLAAGSGTGAWMTGGNAGTNSSQDFVGTTDYQHLIFKTNNEIALKIDATDKSATFTNGVPYENTIISSMPGFDDKQIGYIGFNARRYPASPPYWQFESNTNMNGAAGIIGGIDGDLRFFTVGSQPSPYNVDPGYADDNSMMEWGTKMIIKKDGKVGIGVRLNCQFDGDYKLYVTSGIRTEKIKVDVAANNNWADFVFEKDYKLLKTSELENFIKKNKHLPGIPTASEVVKNGVDLGEMQVKLLQKVEELTLYVIELEKKVEILKAENNK